MYSSTHIVIQLGQGVRYVWRRPHQQVTKVPEDTDDMDGRRGARDYDVGGGDRVDRREGSVCEGVEKLFYQ